MNSSPHTFLRRGRIGLAFLLSCQLIALARVALVLPRFGSLLEEVRQDRSRDFDADLDLSFPKKSSTTHSIESPEPCFTV